MIRKLFHPTDFSTAAEKALSQTEALARLLGGEIHLFHKVVYPFPHPPAELLSRLDDSERFDDVLRSVIETPEREARGELDRRAEELRARGFRVHAYVARSGEVFDEMEKKIQETHPDLVVMGTHGRTGASKWLMGSVAEKALRHAPCDVLTLHENSPVAGDRGGLGEILVATDFSDCSRRALQKAEALAESASGELCIVHVLEAGPMAEGANHVARAEAAVRAELSGRRGESVVASGHPAVEIVRIARERGSRLIVLGTHGRTGLAHLLIGSVAERVARFAEVPVLTVR